MKILTSLGVTGRESTIIIITTIMFIDICNLFGKNKNE
jgi:hypothetical protein